MDTYSGNCSHSHAKGHVYDADVAVGYQFKWCDNSFSISPLVGYSWNGQHINDDHVRNGGYSYDDVTAVSGSGSSYYDSSYGGRNSSYHTRWNGPFVGFDFDYRFGCGCDWDWQIFGTYEFHWATYHANAKWNLRPDLCDGFQHHAKNAYGNVFDIGVRWDFCECWTLAVKGKFQWWWADHGHDRARIGYCDAGNARVDCHLRVPLREVRWDSAAVIVDLGMVF